MRTKTVLFSMLVVLLVLAGYVGTVFYRTIFRGNVVLDSDESFALYIPTGSDFGDLMDQLTGQDLLRRPESFLWLAHRKNLPSHVNPGKYLLYDGMSNNDLVNLIRSGRQEPVQVSFTSLRSLSTLAAVVGRQIEADSAGIMKLLTDNTFLAEKGWEPHAVYALLIPNTYEFYWNTSPEAFFSRMMKEFEIFWKGERERKAGDLGLTRLEVSTLASIVDEETNFDEEKPTIAGVYLNRLEKGIPLQADPTIKFALGDFGIKRILTKQLSVESPYNTYRNRGLPPGPVRIPSVSALESVLNAEKHDYYYFCAKEDFSGYHYFSRTLQQHNQYAARYRNALNRNRILR